MEFTRESVFISAVRTFVKSFAAILGVVLALLLIILMIVFATGPTMFPHKTELTILPDAEGRRELLAESAPVILHLPIHGVIGEDDLMGDSIDKVLLDSREDLFKNNRVKAVLLHMNTPGGTVDDSDQIYRSLMEYKKKYNVPIYAYVSGMCASGGMYITSAADKIYAAPPSIIGSIGVLIGPMFNISQAMEKIGLQSLTLTEGKDKDMLNPFRPWKPGEDHSLKVINDVLYQQFVAIFTAAHPRVDKTKLIEEYGANIFIGETAEKMGYIDVANSNYNTALQELAKAAGIAPEEKYQVVELTLPRSFIYELANGQSPLISGKITHRFDFGSHYHSDMSGKFLYLYLPPN
jgi:protease IV